MSVSRTRAAGDRPLVQRSRNATIPPGVATAIDSRRTRRSKCTVACSEPINLPLLETMRRHAPIESAAAESKRLCGVADVAVVARERLLDECALGFAQRQFLETLR